MINPRSKYATELGFNNYLVFDTGRVENTITRKELKQTKDKDGYKSVTLFNKGNGKKFRAHRLVALLFIPNPKEKPAVNHIDGIKDNNHVDNLEWVTNRENTIHAFETGLIKQHMTGDKVAHEICRLLEQGRGITEIANLLDVGFDVVKQIKYGASYINVSVNYKIPKANKCSSNLSDNFAHKICAFMSEGHPNSKVCETFNVTQAVVTGIRNRSYYTKISDDYIFPPPKKSANVLPERVVKLICSEISKKQSVLNVAKKVGCKPGVIYAIKGRKNYTVTSKNYTW